MRAPTYVDGVRTENHTLLVTESAERPPAELQRQHLYGSIAAYPSFSSPGAVNVKTEFGAVGNGVVDDTDAIQRALNTSRKVFLPKGIYRISSTLSIPPGVSMVGVSNHLVVIAPMANWFASPSTPTPLIRIEMGACPFCDQDGLGTVLHGIMTISWMHTPHIFALDWQAEHPLSVYRMSSSWIKPDFCTLSGALKPCPSPGELHGQAMMVVEGAGLFYVVCCEFTPAKLDCDLV